MELWDWQAFWNEFTPPVVVAAVVLSAILSGLTMLAAWAFKRSRKAVFWSVVWLMMFTVIGSALLIVQPNDKNPIDPARPYFIKAQSRINPVSIKEGGSPLYFSLVVSVQNNERPATGVVNQLMILSNLLDPTVAPLRSRRIKNANDIGPRQYLNFDTRVSVGRNTKSAFIVFEVRYTDIFTNESYSQTWFMKFLGSTREGAYRPSLSDANYDERTRIENYIKQRNIPMLTVLGGLN